MVGARDLKGMKRRDEQVVEEEEAEDCRHCGRSGAGGEGDSENQREIEQRDVEHTQGVAERNHREREQGDRDRCLKVRAVTARVEAVTERDTLRPVEVADWLGE